jgi:hypothetical protein
MKMKITERNGEIISENERNNMAKAPHGGAASRNGGGGEPESIEISKNENNEMAQALCASWREIEEMK